MSDAPSESDALKSAVRRKYAALATEDESSCGSSACCGDATEFNVSDEYDVDPDLVDRADLDLGCGIPTDDADLRPGECVLDLGSGAGMDAFVARRAVGAEGRIHGVDLAPEMVKKARANAEDLGYENVTFEVGDIEDLPLEDRAFDVVLSNCVLNLVPDKGATFAEMHRVLRPGGRFCVSDIVHVGALPDALREPAELYVGCIAGAMERAAYLEGLRDAGFGDVHVATEKHIALPKRLLHEYLSDGDVADVRQGEEGLQSITVVGRRPA